MVTMAIVGVIFAVSLTGLRSAFSVNLKGSAGKLAATLRYMSNKAVTDHMYLRMVYDFQDKSYHAEESADPMVVSPEEDEGESKKEGDNASGGGAGQLSDEDKKKAAAAASGFTPSESVLLQPTKLPSDVGFKDIMVSYLNGKRDQGKAYTYFFPDGFATPTVINLKNDADDEHYSIEVLPLSGRVKVLGDYKESLSEESKMDDASKETK